MVKGLEKGESARGMQRRSEAVERALRATLWHVVAKGKKRQRRDMALSDRRAM